MSQHTESCVVWTEPCMKDELIGTSETNVMCRNYCFFFIYLDSLLLRQITWNEAQINCSQCCHPMKILLLASTKQPGRLIATYHIESYCPLEPYQSMYFEFWVDKVKVPSSKWWKEGERKQACAMSGTIREVRSIFVASCSWCSCPSVVWGLNVIARGFVFLDICTPEVEAGSHWKLGKPAV